MATECTFYPFIFRIFLLLVLTGAGFTGCKSKQPARHEAGAMVVGGYSLEANAHKTLVKAVLPWLGTPHVLGGTTQKGVDCSGFVQEMIRVVWGKQAPRSSREQFEWAKPIDAGKQTGGDLVFFRIRGPKVSHVGLMLDTQHFAHASASSGVRVDHLSTAYYAKTWVGFGRIP